MKSTPLSIAASLLGLLIAVTACFSQARSPTGTIPDLSGKILTVTGPIEPSELGPTLMHEHLFIDYSGGNRVVEKATGIGAYDQPVSLKNLSALRAGLVNSRDNLLITDTDLTIREVSEFQRWGGRGIVDVTSIGLHRDPEALLRVANATGLKIVMGGGFYVSAYHPPDMKNRSVEDLAELIIRDIAEGAEGTRVRTGIIGEVGVQGVVLEESEIKSIRASARASRATGAPISFHHGGRDEAKFRTLDIVVEEGGDPSRVIIGHAHHIAAQVPYMKRLLERGVYLQFDLFGEVIPRLGRIHDAQVIEGILALIQAGYGDRILVSQDVCTKIQLKKYGGMGFSYVMEFVLPEMRRLGITQEQIHKIMVENPRRILTFAAPKQP
jgi:phosphotriesterase-related protein